MPLCTLEIPRTGHNLPDSNAIAICEKSLNLTLKRLNIPSYDQEYRIMDSNEIDRPNVSISFTVGRDEYDRGVVFDPSRKNIIETAKSIRSSLADSGLKFGTIIMEPWNNTTFIIRSEDDNQEVPLSIEFEERTPQEIGEFKVTLAISPEKRAQPSVAKEGESPSERGNFQEVGRGISNLIKDTLELSEVSERQMETLLPRLAQTDISVEIDFPDISKPFSSQEQEYLARSVMQRVLNLNSLTREGSATVWVRQGKTDAILG